MEVCFVSNRKTPITHIARILSPLGVYPADSVQFDNGSGYFAAHDLSFSLFPYLEPDEDAPYSEVQWLYSEEVRIYMALMMAVDREVSYAAFYPYPYAECFKCRDLAQHPDEIIEVIKPLLVKKLFEPDVQHPGFAAPARNPYKHSTDITAPRISSGTSYDFREDGIDYDLAESIHEAIDLSDGILMRGLTTFLRSGMLKSHYQFYEEGINNLFISLEATFRLIQRRLRQNGLVNPSAKDAATFIHDTFDEVERLEKYFEEDRELRNISFHPESKYGIFSSPPIAVDDFYFLFNALLEVYRFLLTGYIQPKYRDRERS